MDQSQIYESQEIIPNSYVSSCLECSWEKMPDGSPNILGALQRKMLTKVIENAGGRIEWLECRECPVYLKSCRTPATTAEGKHVYWKNTDVQLTEQDLIRLQMDGGADLYVDIR